MGGRNATAVVGGVDEGEAEALVEAGSSSGGSSSSSGSGGEASEPKQSFLKTLWDFSRPHTMVSARVGWMSWNQERWR